MSIYTEINKAWATLFGFKVENNEASFNDKPLYWNNNAVSNWDDLLSAKPSDLKQSAGFTETPNTKTYDELMTAENFSYGAFEWTNEHGTRYGFSMGYYYAENVEGNFNLYLGFLPHGVTTELYSAGNGNSENFKNAGLGYAGNDDTTEGAIHFDLYNQGSNMAVEYPTSKHPYSAFYMKGLKNQDVLAFEVYKIENIVHINCYHYVTGTWLLLNLENTTLDNFDTTYNLYFDDGEHLPEGVEWNEELSSYFVPKVKETETTTILTQTTATQAILGAQIMTHVSLWGMGIGCACFIVALVKFMGRCFSRR